jgi:SAM-dependent methyltransferase
MNRDAVQEIARERAIHGSRWENLHDGYFSSPVIAAPFIKTILHKIDRQHPEIVVDLGGGTGFVSSLLASESAGRNMEFLDIDHSDRQLDEAEKRHVRLLNRKIDEVSRGDINPDDRRMLLVMRSVLHYFGMEGLPGILKHIRGLARPGEYFIHQTACFEEMEGAGCLNLLYRLMGTGKQYTDRRRMCGFLESAGWKVEAVEPAPPLLLRSDELGIRYGLSQEQTAEIAKRVPAACPGRHDLFRLRGDGVFEAELRYMIYTCRA